MDLVADKETYLNMMGWRCVADLQMLGIPIHKPVAFEVMESADCWGECSSVVEGDATSYTVRVDRSLLDCAHEEGLRSTLYHELLHTIDACHGHDDLWLDYAAYVSRHLGVDIHVRDSMHDKGFGSGLTGKVVAVAPPKLTPARLRAANAGRAGKAGRAAKGSGLAAKGVASAATRGHAHPDRSDFRYLVQCATCGTVYGKNELTEAVLHPERLRCRCGGRVVRLR